MSILLQGAYAIAIGGLLLAGAALIGRLLRDRGRAERGVWATALALAVGLPFLLPHLTGPVASGAAGGAAALGPVTVLGFSPAVMTLPKGSILPELGVALIALWVAASAILTIRFVGSLRTVRRIRDRARPLKDGPGRILVTERHGPAVVGVARPIILVPEWIRTLSTSRRRWVLRHEIEHIRGRDPWLLALIVTSRILVPWNPVVWRLGSRLRAAIETDCDRRTVGRRNRRGLREYGEALLALAGRPGPDSKPLPGIASTFAEPRLPLEERIRALTTQPRRLSGVVRVVIAGVAVLVVGVACEMPTPTTDDPTVPETVAPAEMAPDPAEDPTLTPWDVAPAPQNTGEVIRALEAEYPPMLKDSGIGGTVVVWFYIDAEGAVQDTRLHQSSGYDALDAAALRVAETYEFSPAQNRGKAVPVWVQIPISFTTSSAPTTPAEGAGSVELPPEPGADPTASPSGVASEADADPAADPALTPYDVAPAPQNTGEVIRALADEYPPMLKDSGIGGTVVVWFYIDAEGAVRNTRLLQSSGYDALDDAALRVAETYEFSPARNRGKAVPVWVQIPIKFTVN